MSGGNLRPYYEPDSFRSPVKGHNGLTVVHGMTSVEINGNQTVTKAAGSAVIGSGTKSGVNSGNGGGFVYLDASDNLNSIAMSLTRLYARILISQPFEVSRLLLQVGDWKYLENEVGQAHEEDEEEEEDIDDDDNNKDDENDDENDDDEINYFTTVSGDYQLQEMRRTIKAQKKQNRRGSSSHRLRSKKVYSEVITPSSIRIFDIMSAVNEKDGIKGLWRGLHTTFILDALSSMVEAWLSGFLSSISGIPDPQFVEVLHSPSPMISLSTAVTASIMTAVLLSPIDVMRTRFAITTFSTGPRSFRTSMIRLKSYTSPWLVLIPTVLQSGFTSLIHLSTPYILYTKLGIDMFSSPSLYSIMSLFSSLMELSVKIPLETLTRRAHVDSLRHKSKELIVRPKKYPGVVGSLWDIITGRDKAESLFRGWRVSVVGLLGEWGVRAIQNVEREREHF